MEELIIRDRASGVAHIVTIGNKGYEIYCGERVNTGVVNLAPVATQPVATQPVATQAEMKKPEVNQSEEDVDIKNLFHGNDHIGIQGRGRIGKPLEYHQHQLIIEILTIAGTVQHTPTKKEFDAHTTTISSRAVRDYFGTYNNGIIAAGLEPNRKHAGHRANNHITRKETNRLTAIECIKYLTNRLGHVPSEKEVGESREISMKALLSCFDSLDDAIHAAGLINPTKKEGSL